VPREQVWDIISLHDALLESYLALVGEEETVLPDGYILIREEEGGEAPVEVCRTSAEDGFEQLWLENS
jgi:hypothetical protein